MTSWRWEGSRGPGKSNGSLPLGLQHSVRHLRTVCLVNRTYFNTGGMFSHNGAIHDRLVCFFNYCNSPIKVAVLIWTSEYNYISRTFLYISFIFYSLFCDSVNYSNHYLCKDIFRTFIQYITMFNVDLTFSFLTWALWNIITCKIACKWEGLMSRGACPRGHCPRSVCPRGGCPGGRMSGHLVRTCFRYPSQFAFCSVHRNFCTRFNWFGSVYTTRRMVRFGSVRFLREMYDYW